MNTIVYSLTYLLTTSSWKSLSYSVGEIVIGADSSRSALLGLRINAVLPGSKDKKEIRVNYTVLVLYKRRPQISSSGETKSFLVINPRKCLLSEKERTCFLTVNLKDYINISTLLKLWFPRKEITLMTLHLSPPETSNLSISFIMMY